MKQYAKLRYEIVEWAISKEQIGDLYSIFESWGPRKKIKDAVERGRTGFLIAYEPSGNPVGCIQYRHDLTRSPLETRTTIVRDVMRRRGIAEKMTYYLIGYARHQLNKSVQRPYQTSAMIDLAKKIKKRRFYGRDKTKPLGPHEEVHVSGAGNVSIKPIRRRK